jgi:OmpA-OmpF porin, OOP family
MKKLTICLATLLASVYGSAQVRVGITGGYHHAFASPAFYSTDHIQNASSLSQRSGHVGVAADIPLDNRWFFQTGVSYYKRGQKQSFTLDTSLTKTHYVYANQEQQYLDLPFSIAYKLPLNKNIRFVVGGGPQLSVFVSGSETVTTVDTFNVIKQERQEDLLVGKGASRYKSSFISVTGFAGFELKNVYLTGSYSKGLTDYYDRIGENFRHDSWGATLGIYIFRARPEKEPVKVIDSDNDGIIDTDDICPTLAGSTVTNGCPDKDGDGIADNNDSCPDIAGTAKYKGCPIPDTDGDGVNDEEDKCPAQAGSNTNNGCPIVEKEPQPIVKEKEVVVDQKVVEQINMNAKQIAFRFGKAALTTDSYAVLDEIVNLLKDADVKIKVEGHSSLEGNPKSNLKLSQERADNVKNYLVSKGIAAERITSIGYGSTRPLVKGATEKANIQNRRVEISIEK